MAWADGKKGLSSFSVILTMVILAIVGLGVVPLVGVQYTPSVKSHNLALSFEWNGSSARGVEQDVTSKLEGVLASLSGLKEINSTSSDNGGEITLAFKDGVNIESARFEAVTLIRQVYPHLPQGVTFPTFSTNSSAQKSVRVLTYTLNSPLTTNVIESFAQKNIINQLSDIDGVGEVTIYGATPFEWVIEFDYNRCQMLGVSSGSISSAIHNEYLLNEVVGDVYDELGQLTTIKIASSGTLTQQGIEDIIIPNNSDRVVRLSDVAKVLYKQALPKSYYRINGLNTITISIYAESGVNTIKLVSDVKECVAQIEESFPSDFSMMLSYDSSEYIKKELNKIYLRTLYSILILLSFVFLVSRSLRYTSIIVITLTVNILISFILYYLLKLDLHIYSLAGITVSLGIIIDTGIMMIDHYGYYHNRKVFFSILGALLTSIGSLIVVFFLPEGQKANLVDFALVIIINLTVSLFIAYLFIPSLMDKIKVTSSQKLKSIKIRRRIVRFSSRYQRYIDFGRRHRWAFVVAIVLFFGTPIHLLPSEIDEKKSEHKEFAKFYNETLGSDLYQGEIKPVVDVIFGGLLRPFTNVLNEYGGYREPAEVVLHITASMPQGCTVHQLNEVMLAMENYLSSFEQIKMYQTSISSNENGRIDVTFKEPNGAFPFTMQESAIRKAINYGGANWRIYGVGNNFFNNNVMGGSQSYRIKLTGYNYDELFGYAEQLLDTLTLNKRVSDASINEGAYSKAKREVYFDYNKEAVANSKLDIDKYFQFMRNQLYNSSSLNIPQDDGVVGVVLKSDESESFDVWNARNSQVMVDSLSFKLADFGTIEQRTTGIDILKENQEYMIYVGYNFVGSSKLQNRYSDKIQETFEEILPIGFSVDSNPWGRWSFKSSRQYLLIFLVIVIIYFICSIMFESLLKPLTIIMLIPLSFAGLFLTFIVGEFHFDQGGYAAFVLLCGLVVNAGIYIIYEYMNISENRQRYNSRIYIKAFNRKIIPISLTIISTVLGLLPFIIEGDKEVFWFSFAIGSIGGIMFSLVAVLFFLPILIPLKK